MTQQTQPRQPSYEDVLKLVKQLSVEDKLKLSKELEKDTISNKLTDFLETFKSEELSLDTIWSEVEAVRTEMYEEHETT
ncbi:MAG: hypothetical protein AB4060_10055 [Crocosphaera sp.]